MNAPKRCPKCREYKEPLSFNKGQTYCRPCHYKMQKASVAKKPALYRALNRKKQLERINTNRFTLLRQVGGCCQKCGWNARPDVLEFDHVIPRLGRGNPFSVDISGQPITSPKLWNHFHQIEVLCPNCHRIKTKDGREAWLARNVDTKLLSESFPSVGVPPRITVLG